MPGRVGTVFAILALLTSTATAAVRLPTGFRVEHVVAGPFTGEPVGFAFLPDGRAVLIEQSSGVVRVAARDAATAEQIFRIPDVEGAHPERGLLGVAVDPNWPARPYLYFCYTRVDSTSRVAMFTASGALSEPGSTALALTRSYVLLSDVPDSAGIHNAGSLRFGPDGMLYVSFGDDARSCAAQDPASPLGKILRLDVHRMPGPGPGPPPRSEITPADNPFAGPDEWRKLTWAWGLRNPFRFSIDPALGDLFIANVGWNWYEEIELVRRAGGGGENFGWPQFEGPRPVLFFGPCGERHVFTEPIHTLAHPLNPIAIVGGPLYRRVADPTHRLPPDYDGDYFYLEFYSGSIYRLRETNGAWDFAPPEAGQPDSTWGEGFRFVSDFQEGADGALWLVATGGGIAPGLHRITTDPAFTAASHLAATGGSGPLRAIPNPALAGSGAVVRYRVVSPGPARLSVFDVGGHRIRTLVDPTTESGFREIWWDGRTADGRPVSAGVYLLRLDAAGGSSALGKVTVVR